ncbi:class II glutamine amidotransferase, partial [Candidatus Marinimicrobia bacterium]|nr:class II glutamine amidotransferase [Candidatus Neomarinimicrobiota bacterium]
TELSACKIWAIISKHDRSLNIQSQDELLLINEQLGIYFNQSQYNANGWSILQYPLFPAYNEISVYRSALPANYDSLNYWNEMLSVFNDFNSKIAIAHLRSATSGASDIPNPHPWIFEGEKTFSFVHNGGASKDLLYDIITENGINEEWLILNPPQTFGAGNWADEGWSAVVDSELIMLLIMKMITAQGDVIEGLNTALRLMLEAGINPYMLNFVFSDSDNLYIYGGSNGLKILETEGYYSIMTTPPASASDFTWEPIASNELVVINSNELARYPTFVILENDNSDLLTPKNPKLFNPYPNPFNGRISLSFDVDMLESSSISIYTIAGKKVFDRKMSPIDKNKGEIYWSPNSSSASNISSGIYIVQLISQGITSSSKIMFIK